MLFTTSQTGHWPSKFRSRPQRQLAHVTRSSYGIVEYTPEAQRQADLNLFYSNLQRQIPSGYGPTIDLIDGAVVQTTTESFDDNGESDLDLEYAIALGKLCIKAK